MARPQKESVSVNIKMDKDIAKMLEDYSVKAGQTKTIVIERAVKEYIEKRNGEKK